MITFLKKYTNDSFEKLVNEIHWMDLPFRLKAIFSKLPSSGGDSRPYKVYTALLTQSGTDAPVATVLENTLGGEVVWSRDSNGTYIATPSEPITNAVFPKPNSIVDSVAYFRNEAGTFFLETVNVGGGAADDLLSDSLVEIRVYN